MKRFLALAALVLGLASCQTEPEGLNVNVGGEVDTYVTVSLPETTRANSAEGAFVNIINNEYYTGQDMTIRYVFQVFYGEGENQKAVQKQVYYTDDMTASFPVRLVPGRHYNFVAWADIVAQPEDDKMGKALPYNEENVVENHYNVANLKEVKFNSIWNAMDETRDAYTGFYNTASEGDNNKYTGTSSINIQMTRPFAKLRVITTDMEQLNDLRISPTYATVEYTKPLYLSFNACDGEVNDETSAAPHKTHYQYTIKTDYEYDFNNDEPKVLFTDYLFAPDYDHEVNFILTVYDQNGKETENVIKSTNFNTPIPAHRNYLTTIQGNVLTDGNKIEVNVTDAFENVDNNGNTTNPNYDYETISSVAELLAAIKANDGEYILISDLDVNGVTASALAATRAAGDGTTINLNGYTITLKTDINVPAGNTLIINDEPNDEGNEEGTIISAGGAIVNKGTLNIEGGSFGANTIKNEDNGVINITGGEFKDNLSDFVPDGYDVENNEDGSYTVTESEPVAEIGDVQYTTLQAAFDAVVGETTITLLRDATFKNTSVLAEGKAATLDLNGKTLAHADETNKYALNNHGTLTIKDSKGNGSINSRGIYNGYGNGGENVATAKLTIVNGTFNAKGTNGGAAVFNYGIVDVNGGAFTSIGGYSLNNQSGASMTIADGVTANNGLYATGATVTINGGEISGNRSGCHVIYAYNSAVTINGGTLYNNNSGNSTVMAAGSTKITYNGGTYGIKDGRVPGNGNTWTSCLLDSQNSAEVVVNDGTYNGGFRVQAGTSMTINGGSFNDCYGSNYNIYGTVTVKGGTYTDAAAIAFAVKYVAEGYMAVDNGDNTSSVIMPAAKVGSTIYTSIDEAITAWTNNSTLTLLNDVTLSDVVTLNSTEHHILDLGTYTMTAASGKNAFEIIAKGTGASERTAITIKADANNPGCINAVSKSVVYYNYANGTATGDDRPIIKIEGGIFYGGTSSIGTTAGIYFKGGSEARQAATLNISGGEFYCAINGQTKSKLLISGGLFHYSVGSQGDSTALRLISGGTFKTLGFMTADSKNTKFWFGTSMGNSNVGLYINDDNYLVVGGPVITEFGDKFAAKATNPTKWSSYLQYSSAASNGLYYTNAAAAIAKHGEANVVLK